VLLAASVVAGAGGGAIDAGINSWVALRRGAGALNVLHGCYGVGAALGPAAISVSVALGSWRVAYGAVTALLALLALLVALSRSSWDGGAVGSRGAASTGALRVPAVWVGVIAFFLYVGVEVGAAQWAYSLLVEARGLPAPAAAAVVSVFWIVFTVARFLFGFLASGRPLERLLVASLLVAVAGATCLVAGRGAPASGVALGLLGFGLAPVFPLLIALTPARVGLERAPAAIGLQVAGATVGGAVVPAGLGLLACSVLLVGWCGALASRSR
jgi:fucose permease